MDNATADHRRLEEQRDFYRSLFDAATDLIIVIDTNRRMVIETNRSTRERLGYSEAELCDMPCLSLFALEDTDEVCRHLSSGEENGTLLSATLIGRDGSAYPVELSIVHYTLHERALCVAICRDIAERRVFERQLIEARENAERSNHLKSAFLANMSHELRTPMNAILGFSELLCDELADRPQQRMAEIINTSGHRLLDTLNSILDLSIIEANRMQIVPDTVHVQAVADEVCMLFRQLAERKGLRLETEFGREDIFTWTDPRLLRQIINNLLGNAIKFTTQGYVRLQIDVTMDDGEPFVRIRVRDTGIGIDSEHLQAIFDEFRQVSEGYGRRFDGTGLGLAITRRFTAILDGRIEVDSAPDQGSLFTVLLPIRAVPPEAT